MTVLISGSIAVDSLLSSPFPFALDAAQIASQRLAVSYYMPELRHEWGGCAANIAYALKLLGGDPLIMATVGSDAGDYLARFKSLNIRTEGIKTIPSQHTAKAVILSDSLGQQITGFHPGAMNEAHTQTLQDLALGITPQWAIVSPDGKQAMLERSAQLKAQGVPFIADPGQAMPIMGKDDLTVLMDGAAVLAVNEHEATMLETALSTTVVALSHALPVVVTLGDQGLALWQGGVSQKVAAIKVEKAVDPTGCGDCLRGAWLFGLTQGWSMLDSLRLGNLMAAFKVQHQGAQGYSISLTELKSQWSKHYNSAWPSAVS